MWGSERHRRNLIAILRCRPGLTPGMRDEVANGRCVVAPTLPLRFRIPFSELQRAVWGEPMQRPEAPTEGRGFALRCPANCGT
eukprot:7181409-Alexandrium_andersonii.AAC.1